MERIKEYKRKFEGNNAIIFFMIIALLGVGYTVLKNGLSLWKFDLYLYWKSNAYAIRGYDLYKCVTGEVVLDSIGKLEVGLTLPWARFLSNLIIPGFLPWNVCIYYFYILWIGLSFVATGLTIKMLKSTGYTNKIQNIFLSIVIIVSPFYWQDAINTGNIGGVLCIIAYIGVLIADSNPFIASICFAISCVKPQDGALFLVMLFVVKRYKVFFSSIGILIVNLIIGEGYVALSSNQLSGIDNIVGLFQKVVVSPNYGDSTTPDFYTYGIFDPLNMFGVNGVIVSVLSALSGIILIFVIYNLIPKSINDKFELIIMGAVAALGSVIWSYKTPCDEVIMISCNLVLIYSWIYSKKTINQNIAYVICMIAFNCKVNRFWLYHLISMPQRWAIFADSVLRMVAMIVIIQMIKRNMKEV